MRKFPPILWTSMLIALSACGGSGADAPIVEPPPPPPPPPPPAAVASVAISPTDAALIVGRTAQLTATPRDAAGAALTRTVTWTSSASGVATVSAAGLVTALAPGEARITATSESVSGNVTVTVSPVPVASVTLSTLAPLVPRATHALTATAKDSAGGSLTGRRIAWASANTAIATVNDSGVVTAVSAGTTRITATVEGRSAEVSAVVRDGGMITNAGGTATGASGAFSLTVPLGAVTGNVALTVDRITEPPAHVRLLAGSAFRVAPAATTFAQPAALRMTYGTLPAGMRARQLRVHRWDGAAWQPLPSAVDTAASRVNANVSAAGDFALIDVPVPVATVVVTPAVSNLATGDTVRLSASVRAANGDVLTDRTVTWSSSNTATATVSSTGLVTAVAPGATVTITATSEGQSGAAQVNVAAPFTFASIALGAFHTCGLTEEGEAWCWGDSDSCETGIEPCVPARPLPVRVNTSTRFSRIVPGNEFTCALSLAGAAWCWGLNASGNLGNGNFGVRPVPAPVSGGLTFTAISSGARHVCGLVGAGTAWCWGSNNEGQLGTGAGPGEFAAPARVATELTFATIGAGSEHTCALTHDGAAWCWGENSDGESGNGTAQDVDRPVRVSGNHVFTSIAVGEFHACGVKATGALWCWGWNRNGQLGDGTTTSRLVPVQVSSTDQFSQVYPFGWSTCALNTTGQATCWGENADGELGNGGNTSASTPTPVSGSHTFRSLAPGGLAYHMCGLTTTETWYCWGWNFDGQLGDGTLVDRRVPTRLPMPSAANARAMSMRAAPAATSGSSKARKVRSQRE